MYLGVAFSFFSLSETLKCLKGKELFPMFPHSFQHIGNVAFRVLWVISSTDHIEGAIITSKKVGICSNKIRMLPKAEREA